MSHLLENQPEMLSASLSSGRASLPRKTERIIKTTMKSSETHIAALHTKK